MTLYGRFERLVAIALCLIAVLNLAFVQSYGRVLPVVLGGALNPLDN